MDITLERILSLLPRTPAGKIVRGAKKDFAISLGYDSGDIVSMWESGTSTSYKKKIHEIATKYNVSVEWLRGESEQKENPTDKNGEVAGGLGDTKYFKLNDENRALIDSMIEKLLKSQSDD